MDISEKIKFYDVCVMLEKIAKVQGFKAKEQQLKKYMESFREFQEKFKKDHGPNANFSFYCILRLLIPNADTARDSYGIQVVAMGRLYIRILNLAPNSEDALKLTYKSSTYQSGDFADIVYSIMKGRTTESSNKITLSEVHQMLDSMAEKDMKSKEQVLSKFIETSSAMEQKWLIRIIFKKLHLGIGEQGILSIYHPKARELYTTNTDLKNLCDQIENGIEIPIVDNVCPFKHVRPMLCQRLDLPELNALLETKTFYLETKMDGERFHIHMVNEEYKYISRGGKDYTLHFGRKSSEGNLTPFLCKLYQISIRNLILDGEMMVWDKSSQSYRVKGENIDVKHLQIGGNLRPCFVVYDLLYLNDVSYLDKPYRERIDLLRKIIKEQIGVLEFCKRDKLRDMQHFTDCFNDIMNRSEEGIVIKDQVSKYSPGIRGGGWYKVKSDYVKGLVSDFDLLILGGFYNQKRTYIESYLVGVYKKSNENEIGTFYCVGKVASGLSFPEQKSLNERLEKHWIHNRFINGNNHRRNLQNDEILWGSTIPDVWIEPKNSIILQIKASELHRNNSFGTSYALRFPRVETIRNDKIWNECMTLEEYEKLCGDEIGVKKIHKRKLNSEDFVRTTRPRSTTSKSMNFTNPYCSVFSSSEVEKVSDEFEGLDICIINACREKGKTENDLKALVKKHGGRVVENPTSDHNKCICVAGDANSYRVKKLKETGLYNIVSVDWLIRAFSGDKVSSKSSQIKPCDIICTTSEMKEKLKKLYDPYGDSYTENVNVEELKQLLNALNSQTIIPLMESEIYELEQELCFDVDIQNIFRMIQGCFYSSTNNNVDNDDGKRMMSRILMLAKLTFESRGGCTLNPMNDDEKRKIQCVFVDAYDLDRSVFKSWLKRFFESHSNKIQILSYNWIFDCNVANKKLDMYDYLVSF